MFTRGDGGIAIVWLPNALLVAILLRHDIREGINYLPAAFAANVLAGLVAGDSFVHAAMLALANQLEITAIWLTMRRLNSPRPDIQDFCQLSKFTLVGGVIGPALSGTLAAAYLAPSAIDEFFKIWLQWAATNGLGMLLLAPTTMVLIDRIRETKQEVDPFLVADKPDRTGEWIVIQGAVIAATIVIFGMLKFPLLFAITPLLILSAFRLGIWGTAFSTIAIALIAAICAAYKLGPFYALNISLTMKLLILQFFLLSCFLTGLPVASLLSGREKARLALRKHHDLGSSMLQNMKEVIFRTNARGEWVFLNPAWENLTGIAIDAMIGEKIEALVPRDRTIALYRKLGPILGKVKSQCNFEWALTNADGNRVDVEISISPLFDQRGKFAGAVGNIRDITERKRMENSLIAAQREAEIAVAEKSRFLINMNSEIRAPITSILGTAQLLLDSAGSHGRRDQLQLIHDSSSGMIGLLDTIDDLFKSAWGERTPNFQLTNLTDILRSSAAMVAKSANQKQLDLHLEIDPEIPDKIISDGDYLRKILSNLLGNAIKFTSQGHVTLRARIEQFHRDVATIIIDVADSGFGISPAGLAAIFKPFAHGDNDIAAEFRGNGLGLATCRQLAEQLLGAIHVTSEVGSGSTFSLRLPIKMTANRPQQISALRNRRHFRRSSPIAKASGKYTQAIADRSDFRILLAEDHHLDQLLITAMIEYLGYGVELAIDGADAVAKIAAANRQKRPFDLVLMDLQMPLIDGIEATRIIRADSNSNKDLPIIALTKNGCENQEQLLAADMQDQIAKPLIVAELQAILAKWLGTDERHSTGPRATIRPFDQIEKELRKSYHLRKERITRNLVDMVHRGAFTDDDIQALTDQLHRLAGSAQYFGEAELGIQAKYIETNFSQWQYHDRPDEISQAVASFLQAA